MAQSCEKDQVKKEVVDKGIRKNKVHIYTEKKGITT